MAHLCALFELIERIRKVKNNSQKAKGKRQKRLKAKHNCVIPYMNFAHMMCVPQLINFSRRGVKSQIIRLEITDER